jgi:hypothetical protein
MGKTKDASPPLKPYYHIETGEIIKARKLTHAMAIETQPSCFQHGEPGDYLVREPNNERTRGKSPGGRLAIRKKVGFERSFRPGRRAEPDPETLPESAYGKGEESERMPFKTPVKSPSSPTFEEGPKGPGRKAMSAITSMFGAADGDDSPEVPAE